MLGFLSVETPSGTIIRHLKLMFGPRGMRWIGLPSVKRLAQWGQPQLDSRGKPVWNRIVEFRDKPTGGKFDETVLKALRRAHPEAFD
jgi:hypothetical protein